MSEQNNAVPGAWHFADSTHLQSAGFPYPILPIGSGTVPLSDFTGPRATSVFGGSAHSTDAASQSVSDLQIDTATFAPHSAETQAVIDDARGLFVIDLCTSGPAYVHKRDPAFHKAIANEALNQAVVRYGRRKPAHLPPQDVEITDDIVAMFVSYSTRYKSKIKAEARPIVRKHYLTFTQQTPSGPIVVPENSPVWKALTIQQVGQLTDEETELQYLHIVPPVPGRPYFNNPALVELIDLIVWTESTGFAALAPELFRTSMPLPLIAMAGTMLRLVLDEYSTGVHLKSRTNTRKTEETYMQLLDNLRLLEGHPEHGKDFREYLKAWIIEGSGRARAREMADATAAREMPVFLKLNFPPAHPG